MEIAVCRGDFLSHTLPPPLAYGIAAATAVVMAYPLDTAVSRRVMHGSLNVPIEHHPTIRYMVYNGYYKVMSNIPKMGHLTIPVMFVKSQAARNGIGRAINSTSWWPGCLSCRHTNLWLAWVTWCFFGGPKNQLGSCLGKYGPHSRWCILGPLGHTRHCLDCLVPFGGIQFLWISSVSSTIFNLSSLLVQSIKYLSRHPIGYWSVWVSKAIDKPFLSGVQ